MSPTTVAMFTVSPGSMIFLPSGFSQFSLDASVWLMITPAMSCVSRKVLRKTSPLDDSDAGSLNKILVNPEKVYTSLYHSFWSIPHA